MAERLSPYTARVALDFIVIGASITGLACAYNLIRAGHRVRILERDDRISGGYAGLKSPPNMTRLLIKWGLGPELDRISTKCSRLAMRIGSTGECIGALIFHDQVMEELQADVRLMSHIDLRLMLANLLLESGVSVEFSSNVISVDAWEASVTLSNGNKVYGDVIVGADGAKGVVRSSIVDAKLDEERTSAGHYDCYSFLLPVNRLHSHEDLREFTTDTSWNMWMNERTALFTHLVNGGREIAVHFTYPKFEKDAQPSWTRRVPLSSLDFSSYDPRIQKLLSFCRSAIQIKHIVRQQGQDWVHPSGKIVLMGEAAHIFNPGSLQATALCVEDAAVFGSLFSHIQYRDQISHFSSVFQELRRPRCEEIEVLELKKVQRVTFPKGSDQEQRDEILRKSAIEVCENTPEEVLRQEWEQFRYAFGYDAYEEVESWWVEWGSLEERASGNVPETPSPLEDIFFEYHVTQVTQVES